MINNLWHKVRISAPFLIYGGITLCSSIPGTSIILETFSFWDKLQHFIAYGTFGFAFLLALNPRFITKTPNYKIIIGGMLLCAICAGIDEWHQSFVPGRSPDIFDALADLMGFSIVLISGLKIYKYILGKA